MKTRPLASLMCSLMMAALLSVPGLAADADADETKLQTEQQGIDKASASTPDTEKVNTLVSQYNVTPETVQNLRAKGQGWGEISIGLASAQELFKKDPTTYPTYMDALNKVQSLRDAGQGWGKIANDLGFKLGPVVSAAHRHRVERLQRRHERQEHRRMERMERRERMERPDRPRRTDRPARPERPGR